MDVPRHTNAQTRIHIQAYARTHADTRTHRQGDTETWKHGATASPRPNNAETLIRRDAETQRCKEASRHRDAETQRHRDTETRRHGDTESKSGSRNVDNHKHLVQPHLCPNSGCVNQIQCSCTCGSQGLALRFQKHMLRQTWFDTFGWYQDGQESVQIYEVRL